MLGGNNGGAEKFSDLLKNVLNVANKTNRGWEGRIISCQLDEFTLYVYPSPHLHSPITFPSYWKKIYYFF